jgi:hypothetical protein
MRPDHRPRGRQRMIAFAVVAVLAQGHLCQVLSNPAARAEAVALSQQESNIAALDGAAVRSRLVVRQLKDGTGTRQVLVLGKPVGADLPDFGPACRLDILPRELVRQAVLIAARDELGLSRERRACRPW